MSDKDVGKCSDWKAWYDMQPVQTGTLHVTAKCTFEKSGHSVVLQPASPPSLNPNIYLLERRVTDSSNKEKGVEVTFSEKTKTQYKQVQIRPDNVTIEVKTIQ